MTRNEATFGQAVHVGSEGVKFNYHGDHSTLPFRHGTLPAPLSEKFRFNFHTSAGNSS